MTRPFELRQIVSGEGFGSADQNPVELIHWADSTIQIEQDFERGTEAEPSKDEVALLKEVRVASELILGNRKSRTTFTARKTKCSRSGSYSLMGEPGPVLSSGAVDG